MRADDRRMTFTGRDLRVMAQTVWGEARGEGPLGRAAVAWVILNRVRDFRWRSTIEGVCLQPWQFSCWNGGDANRPLLDGLTIHDRGFKASLVAAAACLTGEIADPTGGATHYHHKALSPRWARGRTPSARIGAHVFYAGID